jgi:hypothetical protein
LPDAPPRITIVMETATAPENRSLGAVSFGHRRRIEMMEAVIELKLFGEFWQVTHNGSVLTCAITRQGAINAASGLLRQQLEDPGAVAGLTFCGLELAELLAAPPMDPNWKRKGSRIEVELFEQAEAYLQTELASADEARFVSDYRTALQGEDFDQALECLVQMGERQSCTNPFWQVLERLADAVWPTQWMADRRAKGQREAKIASIKQRARGWAEPDAPADGGRSHGSSGVQGSRRGRRR